MTRLEDLKKLRNDLLTWLDEAPADRKAALVAQFRATLVEIEELEPKKEAGDGIDEIAKRRAARRSGSTSKVDHSKRSG